MTTKDDENIIKFIPQEDEIIIDVDDPEDPTKGMHYYVSSQKDPLS